VRARTPDSEETARLVVVAALEVELTAVKFWRVDEPVARTLAEVRRAPMKELVEVKEVEKRLVVVA
jgi:hypothetical protein